MVWRRWRGGRNSVAGNRRCEGKCGRWHLSARTGGPTRFMSRDTRRDRNHRITGREKKHRAMIELEHWLGLRFNKEHYRLVR